MYKYIFVVSTPRAGSTLAQSLLMRIDGAVSTYETHFFSGLYRKNLLSGSYYEKHSVINEAFEAVGGVGNLKMPFVWDKRHVTKRFKSTVDMYLCENHGKVFIEKTPMHLHYIDEIERAFGSVLFVHLIREPYENIRSLYDASNRYSDSWGGGRTLNKCVKRWEQDYEIHQKFRGEANHVFFDYSGVLNDPHGFVRCVAENVGRDFDFDRNVDVGGIVKKGEVWKSNNFQKVGVVSEYKDFLTKEDFYKSYPYFEDYKGFF